MKLLPCSALRALVVASLVVTACAPAHREPVLPDIATSLRTLFSTLPPDAGAIAPSNLHARLSETTPFLLDVRSASELEKDGRITGSVNIPLGELLRNLDSLPTSSRPIVTVCATGHRSALAMEALRLLGYGDVSSLAGGTRAWTAAGYAVVKEVTRARDTAVASRVGRTNPQDDVAAAIQRAFDRMPAGWATMPPATLRDLLKASRPLVFDLRTPADRAAGAAIDGAVPVPLDALINNPDLPPDRGAPIVVACTTGHRSALATLALRLLGYSNVHSLAGGVTGWTAADRGPERPAPRTSSP